MSISYYCVAGDVLYCDWNCTVVYARQICVTASLTTGRDCLFPRTSWLRWHWKGNPFWMQQMIGSGTNKKCTSLHKSKQIIMPAFHYWDHTFFLMSKFSPLGKLADGAIYFTFHNFFFLFIVAMATNFVSYWTFLVGAEVSQDPLDRFSQSLHHMVGIQHQQATGCWNTDLLT